MLFHLYCHCPRAATFSFARPNQGEARRLTYIKSDPGPKHLHTQNTTHVCWCPHKHDTCDSAVTGGPCHCDRLTLWQGLSANLQFSCTCVKWPRRGCVRAWRVLHLQGWWRVRSRGRVYASSLWQQWSGSILRVSWGLIVTLKYSWEHRVDKWRYKHTVKFSIGQVSLTSPDTIYCTVWHSLRRQLMCSEHKKRNPNGIFHFCIIR